MFIKSIGIVIFFITAFSASITRLHSHSLNKELLADIRAYCQYVETKNHAKNSLLLSPDLIVRAQNSNNDYPYQNNLITALSKDIADLGKSRQIKALINEECIYYQLNQEANLQIQFAIPIAQRQALNFKLKNIKAAKHKFSMLLQSVQKKIDNQNDTLLSFYKIESSLRKLDEAEREIQATLAIQSPSKIETRPLSELMEKIRIAEKSRQATLNKLEKLNSWSLQVQAGAQHNVQNFNHRKETQPYAGVFLRYNLGSIDSNFKTDDSLNAYTDWKKKQVDGTQKKLFRLIQSISLLKTTEEQRLQQLIAYHNKYYGLGQKLSAVNSSKALKFKQQIQIDQLMTEIEISYLKHFIHCLNVIL